MKKKVLFLVLAAVIILPFAAVYAVNLDGSPRDTSQTAQCGDGERCAVTSCSDLGYDNEVKFEDIFEGDDIPPSGSAYQYPVTIDSFDYKGSGDNKEVIAFDWSSVIGIEKIIIFAGSQEKFIPADRNTPFDPPEFDGSGTTIDNYGISHISFCWDDNPDIDIEKSTNGEDADNPTGPIIDVGEAVTWTYTITNTGNIPLNNVVVTDNQSGVNPAYLSGGDGDSTLEVGEVWTYQATGVAVEGQYTNIGTVNANYDCCRKVSDTDPSHYFGKVPNAPAIDVVKFVWDGSTWQDANSATGPLLTSDQSPVKFKFDVENIGNVPLTDVVLEDNVIGSLFNDSAETEACSPPATLAVDGTFTCYGSLPWEQGQHTNTATVSGEDDEETSVEDTDPANYFGEPPKNLSIDVEKFVWDGSDWLDADTPETGPTLLSTVNPVEFKFEVENTGNVELNTISLTDSDISSLFSDQTYTSACTPTDPLPVGGTFTCFGKLAWDDVQHTNTATVSGEDDEETSVEDNDDANYIGVIPDNPAVQIEKSTNGVDADNPTGPIILVGNNVSWTYTVTNTGNVPLSNVVVTDDQEGVNPAFITGDDGDLILQTDETWFYQTSGTATAGQYSNIGTVTADYGTTEVSDSDPSHYFGADPNVDIEKSTNGEDADTPTGPILVEGSAVTWSYTVTNTGNVPLSNLSVTDDQGVTPVYVSGDINEDDLLQTTETWVFEASGTAGVGQYANLGTVTADYGSTQVSDIDPSHYKGEEPKNLGIDVEKFVWDGSDWLDADTPTGPTLTDAEDPVEFKFVVTNTGNVVLNSISLTDSDTSSLFSDQTYTDACTPTDPLPVDGTFTCYARLDWQEGQHTNTANVSGEDDEETSVEDNDDANYIGVIPDNPAVQIEKSTNGVDADNPTGPTIVAGNTVTWTYTVTNTGNVPLSSVIVTDDQGVTPVYISGDINDDDILQTDETWIFEASGTAEVGQYSNIGTVTADYNLTEVSDTDPSHYIGEAPKSAAIDVEKYVWDGSTWQDADAPTGPILPSDEDPVRFKIEVNNTGDVELSSISLDDDIIDTLYNDPEENEVCTPTDPFPVGASFTCYASLAWQEGQHTNTATVSADDNRATVSDTDPANYFGALASIQLVKSAEPQVYTAADDEILYTYTVTNTGNTNLSKVTVIENAANFTGTGSLPAPVYTDGSSTQGSPEGVLKPGESATYTAAYIITQADVDAGLIDNVATATGEDPFEEILEDTDDERVEGPKAEASIHLSKTASPLTYTQVGTTITYTYVVTNNGPLTLTNVAVIENDADFTGTGPLPIPVYVSGSSTEGSPAGTLLPGESATYTATYAITQADINARFVDNTATATGEDPGGNIVRDTDDATVVDPRGDGGIRLSKTAVPSTYKKSGDAITYTYVVTNTGDRTLTNVDVIENQDDFTGTGSLPIPKYVSGSSTMGSPEGTLLPGESATYRAVYTITQSDVTAKKVINTATASGDSDGRTYTDRDTETINAVSDDKDLDPKPDKPSGGGDLNLFSLVNKVLDWFYALGLEIGLYK